MKLSASKLFCFFSFAFFLLPFVVKAQKIKVLPNDTIYNRTNYEFIAPIAFLENQTAVVDYKMAKEALAKNQLEPALAYVNRAIAQVPNSSDYLLLKGWTLSEMGRYRKAMKFAEKALIADGQNWQALHCRAYCYYAQQKYLDAIVEYSKLIDFKPNFYKAYEGRGAARNALQDYNGAIRDFDYLLMLKPTHGTAYYSRAMAKFHLHNYQAAIVDFNQFLVNDNTNGTAYYYRAQSHLRLSDYAKACSDFSKAEIYGESRAVNDKKQYCF